MNRCAQGTSAITQAPGWALLLLGLMLAGPLPAAPPQATREIEYLIASVQSLQGASFVRNGVSYDAASAAAHMRLKLRMAGSRVQSAEDFIRLCGTGSSVSGAPYEIRFADGRVVASAAFLNAQLQALRSQSPSGR